MASIFFPDKDGIRREVPLVKRITTLGASSDCDLRLEDPSVPEDALHILFDGLRHIAQALSEPFWVNGKRQKEHALDDGDVLRVGSTELRFSAAAAPKASDISPKASATKLPLDPDRELAFHKRLVHFSQQLLGVYELDALLNSLMDEAISVTRADKGFLVLLGNNQPKIKVARNMGQEDLGLSVEQLSDSIVRKVVGTGQPLIVSDALEDPEFSAAQSVVNLKLLSVMCVPLRMKGDLFGLLYVGNDRRVNRFEQKGLDMLTVFAAQASLLLQNALLVNELRLDNSDLRRKVEDHRFGDLIGSCAGMRDVYKRLEKVARTEIPVLITGETGTGKELIAKELHRRSSRAQGPFISLNCGAIPENLLESELFGHVRGAFTGAVTTKGGRFQAANGGTLFLDELGEMPLQLQVKLLRALQEKVVYKVGDHRGDNVDIRVVAATNKVLEDEVKRGNFREDLYYRVNTVIIALPPLREREEDILTLARYFLQKYAEKFGSKAQGFTPAATMAIRKYHWPGNIRELENRLKKATVMSEVPMLGAEDLDLTAEKLLPIVPLAKAKEDFASKYINEVLERNNGNRTKTAKDLGVDPRTIFRHLEKMDGEGEGDELLR